MIGIDRVVSLWLVHLQGGPVGDAIIRLLGVYILWALLALFLILVFKEEGERRKAYLLGFAFLLALVARGIITEIIRFFVKHPRPFTVLDIPHLSGNITSPSFPSGHAVLLAALVCVIAMMAHKRWTIVAIISALISGLARVAMGIHWVSDILAGFLLALIVFFILYRILPPSFGTSSGVRHDGKEESGVE